VPMTLARRVLNIDRGQPGYGGTLHGVGHCDQGIR